MKSGKKGLILFIMLILTLNVFCGESSKTSKVDSQTDSTKQVITVKLPEPVLDGEVSVEKALAKRRSVRKFKKEPLKLTEISQILWAAYGVTKPKDNPGLRGGFKTAPSAGATYPLEIYLVSGDVTGLPDGIYKYRPEEHSLIKLEDGDKRNKLFMASLQPWVKTAPASLVYSAVFERTTKKYGKRGRERYVYIDLGHSAENVYLQATALGLGTVAVGAFNDKKLKKAINMPENEEPLYIMPIGRIK